MTSQFYPKSIDSQCLLKITRFKAHLEDIAFPSWAGITPQALFVQTLQALLSSLWHHQSLSNAHWGLQLCISCSIHHAPLWTLLIQVRGTRVLPHSQVQFTSPYSAVCVCVPDTHVEIILNSSWLKKSKPCHLDVMLSQFKKFLWNSKF